MKINIGFIGAGNMGSALALAAAKSNNNILVTDTDAAKADALAKKCGGKSCTAKEIITCCDYVFLGVKPQVLPSLLESIKEDLCGKKERLVLISMAAGIKTETINAVIGDYPVIRIMPNLPVMLGKGLILICNNSAVRNEEIKTFEDFMSASGKIIPIEEEKIDAASAISGCGPAFAYMFIEALADGGVTCGLPASLALALAAQTLAGASEMVLESGKHPGKLKADVCSPGGTTIAGVHALEEHNFRAAGMDAVIASYKRTKELS